MHFIFTEFGFEYWGVLVIVRVLNGWPEIFAHFFLFKSRAEVVFVVHFYKFQNLQFFYYHEYRILDSHKSFSNNN